MELCLPLPGWGHQDNQTTLYPELTVGVTDVGLVVVECSLEERKACCSSACSQRPYLQSVRGMERVLFSRCCRVMNLRSVGI